MSVENSELENWWENIWCGTKFKLENWYQKLLNRKIGIYEKIIQSQKIDIKHFKSENWCKNFNDKSENFVRNFLVGKLILKY